VIGIVWGRNQRGKTLEEIEAEQGWTSDGTRFDEAEALRTAAHR
jgi:hypothetical protein